MFRHTQHHRDGENTPPYPPPGTNPLHNPHQPPPPPPPQPQPPFYGVPLPSPPPPPQPHHEPATQVFHTSHQATPGPPHGVGAGADPYGYPSGPSLGSVHHVSHEAPVANVRHVSHQAPVTDVRHVSHETHNFSSSASKPASVQHVSHQGGSSAALSNKSIVKVVTKADPNYCLTIRNGKVILAYSDPADEHQRWYKDLKYSTRVKDEEGCPAFSLVNKVTGQAIKHSIGATHPVQLIPYKPDFLDESVLWTESKDLGDGHRAIRMVNNIRLNVDAYHGDKHSGGVHDGTTIVLWEWNNGDNQHWKIVPNCKFSMGNIN